MGNLYLKGPDSKNSKNRLARTLPSRFPEGRPDFFFWKFIIEFKISYDSCMFADVDQSVYGEWGVEFNFS